MTNLLNNVKKKQSLCRKKLQCSEGELHESNTSPTSTADWRTSEQYEEICELKKNNIALKDSLDDTEKKLDHVKLSVNRSESQVNRLSQQIGELQETNRDHVAEANFSSRNVANSLSRVVFGSLVVNSSSVHVERSNPIVEKPDPVLFHRCPFPRHKKPILFQRKQQIKLQLFKRQQTRTQVLAGRNPLRAEELNRGSTDSSAREYCPYITKQNGQYLSTAYLKTAQLDPSDWVEQNFGQRKGCRSASCLIHQTGASMLPHQTRGMKMISISEPSLTEPINERLLSQKSETVTTAVVRVIKNWVLHHRTSKCQNTRWDLRTRIAPP